MYYLLLKQPRNIIDRSDANRTDTSHVDLHVKSGCENPRRIIQTRWSEKQKQNCCYALWLWVIVNRDDEIGFPFFFFFFFYVKNRFRNKSFFHKFRKSTGVEYEVKINNYDWIFSFPVSRVHRTCAFGAARLCVNCINVQPIIVLWTGFSTKRFACVP